MSQAMEWLREETVIRIGQQYRSVGGSDLAPQVLSSCYERMAAWVHLAREALHAEWPTFEAIRAFSVFQLRPRLETSIVKKDLGKICQIFGEQNDLAALTRSYQDIVYTASKKRTLD